MTESEASAAQSNELLSSMDMASFAARGFLRLDEVVPAALNQQFLDDVGHVAESEISNPMEHYGRVMSRSAIPIVNAGTPFHAAYPRDSALHKIMSLPKVAGAIQSLVGAEPNFDHHFLHMTFPPKFYQDSKTPQMAQHTHQDSTIDPRSTFDIQLMYFPHAVTREMGGTRFVPGTHLRIVSEAAISRYQNIIGQQHMVCEAGTILLVHMGIWHGGGLNLSDRVRYMFKIRMAPSEKQQRLWDMSDLPEDHFNQRPIFWTSPQQANDPIHQILTQPEPWFEADTGRLEYVNRVRFWRYLLGDESFDADYWLTRVENEIY